MTEGFHGCKDKRPESRNMIKILEFRKKHTYFWIRGFTRRLEKCSYFACNASLRTIIKDQIMLLYGVNKITLVM